MKTSPRFIIRLLGTTTIITVALAAAALTTTVLTTTLSTTTTVLTSTWLVGLFGCWFGGAYVVGRHINYTAIK